MVDGTVGARGMEPTGSVGVTWDTGSDEASGAGDEDCGFLGR